MPKLLDISELPGFENYAKTEQQPRVPNNSTPDFEKYRARRLADLDAEEKRINSKVSAIKSPSVMYGGENQLMVQRAAMPAEYSQYISALKQLDDTRNALKIYTESDYKRDQAQGQQKGFLSRLVGGAINVNMDDVIPFNPVLQLNSADLNRTLKKAQNGGTLSDAEQTLLRSALGSDQAAADIQSQGGATKAGVIGQSLPQTAKFMAETAILNTLFPAIGNSIHAVKGTKQVAKAVGKYLGNSAIREGGLATLRSNTWETAIDRQNDQYVVGEDQSGNIGVIDYKPETILKSIYLGGADSFTDGFSERFGGILETKIIGKLAPKILGEKIGGAIEKIGQSKVGGLVGQWDATAKKIFNWNGTINEYVEEKFSDAIKPLLTGDDTSWRTFFDARENLITLGSVAVMGSTAIITKAPAMAGDLIKEGTLKKESANHLKSLSTPELKSAIQSAGAEQSLGARYEKLLSIDWSTATKSDAVHAIDYINTRTQYDIFKGAYQVQADDAQNAAIIERARALCTELINPETGNIEVIKSEMGGIYQVMYNQPVNSSDNTRFAINLETNKVEQIDISQTHVINSSGIDDYMNDLAEDVRLQSEQSAQEDLEADIREEAIEAGVDPGAAILSSRGININNIDGTYVQLSDGRVVYIAGQTPDKTGYNAKYTNQETGDQEDVTISINDIARNLTDDQYDELTYPATRDMQAEQTITAEQPQVEPQIEPVSQIPMTNDGEKDYDSMSSDMLARELETDLGHDVAVEELLSSIKYVDSQIKNINNRKAGTLNERVKRYAKITDLNTSKDTLLTALDALQPTMPPLVQTNNDMRGDYLSLDDYILRDIAAGLKFAWNDNGSERGLARELGFTGSEGERRNRISILRNDGFTVDQYAESIVRELGGDLPNWNIDALDARSTIIEVLSRIYSPKQARDEALGLRNKHDESQYYDSRYEDAIKEGHVNNDFPEESSIAADPVRDAATPEEKMAVITQSIANWNSKFDSKYSEGITVFDNNSFDTLPQKVQKGFRYQWDIEKQSTPGVTFGENVYLYASHIRDVADLESTYVHEVLCHRAVSRAVGDVMNEAMFYADLVDNIGVSEMVKLNEGTILELADSYFMDQNPVTKMLLGKEYVAYLVNQRITLSDFQPQTTEGIYVVNEPIRTAQQIIDLILTINSAKNGRGTIRGLRDVIRRMDFDSGLDGATIISRMGTQAIRANDSVQRGAKDSTGVPRKKVVGSIGTSSTTNSGAVSTSGQLREASGIEQTTTQSRGNLTIDPIRFREDLEKSARIEKLRSSATVQITGNEITPSDDLKQCRKNALEYGKLLRGVYVNNDTGVRISLSRDAIKEVLHHDYKDYEHLQSIAAIPQIIEQATYIATKNNENISNNHSVTSYDYYVCGLNIGSVDYTVRAVVATRPDGKKYYDHKLSTIKKDKLIEKLAQYNASAPSGLSSTVGLEEVIPFRPADKSREISGISPISEFKDKRLISILQNNSSEAIDANGKSNSNDIDLRFSDVRLQSSIYHAAEQRRYEQSKAENTQSADQIREAVNNAIIQAEKTFGVEVVRCATRSELPYAVRTRMNPTARYPGAYYDGRVYMMLSEITDPDDAVATYLHEVISHKGIVELLGKENANKFYASVFDSLDDTTQSQLLSLYGDPIVAGDEYVAQMAEGDVSPGVMQRIIGAIRRFFKEVLEMPLRISDNDIRYMLWKSKNNLQNARTLGNSMRIIGKDHNLRMELFDPVRFRERTIVLDQQRKITDGKSAAEIASINLREVLQDNLIRVKLMQDKLRASGGSIDITTDGYTALNRLESVTKAAMDRFERQFMKPLAQFIKTISTENDTPITYTDVSDYVNAKHSIERHDSGVSALSAEELGVWTREVTENIVKGFESRITPAELDELWGLVRGATNEMLRINVESGIMTDEKAREYKARWKYYVPLRGKDFEFEGQHDLSKYYDYITSNYQGKTVRDTLSTKAHGRVSKADDPIATIHHLGFMTIMYAERNKALMYFMRQSQANKEHTDLVSMSEVWYRKTPDGQWYETDNQPTAQEIQDSVAAKREVAMLQRKLRAAIKNNESFDQIEELEENINAAMDKMTVNKVAYTFGSGYQGLSQLQKNEHFVYVMKNGVKQRIHYTDPSVANAINDINDSALNNLAKTKFGQLIGRGTRTLAALSTSKNPAFILANYVRDVQHAYMYSLVDSDGQSSAYLKHAFTSFKPIHRSLTETENPLTTAEMAGYDPIKAEDMVVLTERYGHDRVQDTLYDLFVANGGKTGYLHIEDVKDYGKKLQTIANGDPKNTGKFIRGVNVGLDYMAEISETSTRYAVFLSQLDAGRDILSAVNYAKDITVNFNRKGKWGKGLGMLYLFLNAGVQGSANAAKLGLRNKGRASVAIGSLALMGFVNSLLLESLLGDDDRYWKISDYVRRTNIIIYAPMTEQGYIKIPIPILFRPAWNLGLTVHDFMNGKVAANQAINSIFSTAIDSMSPVDFSAKDPFKVVLPTIVRPLYEIGVSNTDFKGSKINRVPYLSSQQGYVPDSQLGQPHVNSTLKAITTKLNELGGGSEFVPAGMNEDGTTNWLTNYLDVSPSTIEHIVGSYTGGVGQEIMRALNFVTDGEARKQARNIPLLNRFYGQAYKESPSKEYYDIKRILKNTDIMRKSLKNGEPIMSKTLQELKVTVDAKQKYLKRMKSVDKSIKLIEKKMEPLREGTPGFERYRNEIEQLQKEFTKYYNDNNY